MSERDEFLARLRDRLPLPSDEVEEAIAEVATHLEDAAADLEDRGLESEAAEHVAIDRLGRPEVLAREIARAHRSPRDLVTAAGVALRVTLGTGISSLIEGWIALFLLVLAIALVFTAVSRLIGHDLLTDISGPRDVNPLLGAAIAAVAAYAIGRATLPAVARAARRTEAETRTMLLPLGVVVAGAIGLFGIRSEFGLASALATISLPAWFALGMLAPRLMPSWFPGAPRRAGWFFLSLVIAVLLPVGVLLASNVTGGTEGQPVEVPTPAQPDWSHIAPLWSDTRGEGLFESGDSGNVGANVQLSDTLSKPHALDSWTDLHAEVWRAGPAPQSGSYVPSPLGGGPIAVHPVAYDGTTLSADLVISPRPDTGLYLVALVGTAPDGRRYLLDSPDDEFVAWSGSAWDYFVSPR